jgi:hypothetical protein
MVAILKKAANTSILFTLIAHSMCCFLPLVSLTLGVNVLSGLAFHGIEIYLLIFNLVLISLGIYLNFLHKSNKSCSHNKCKKTNYKFIIISSLSLLAVLFQYFHHAH